jgi:hypothetical protein
MSVYPHLHDPRDFHTWFAEVCAHTRVHGISELLDPGYIPPPPLMEEFQCKQDWLYAALLSRIHYPSGEYMVRYFGNGINGGNAQQLLIALANDATSSIQGTLYTQDLFSSLFQDILDGRYTNSLSKSLYDFQKKLDAVTAQSYPNYIIPPEVAKQFLMTQFRQHPVLREAIRNEVSSQRYQPYHESINVLSQSARIPDDVWKNLSKDERKAWASIGTDARALIMDSGTHRQVYMALTDPSDVSPADTPSPPDTELSVHATRATPPKSKKTTFATPQERNDTLNKAQPGDPRRVLSHPPRDFP